MHSLLISSLRAAVESGEKKEQGKKKNLTLKTTLGIKHNY